MSRPPTPKPVFDFGGGSKWQGHPSQCHACFAAHQGFVLSLAVCQQQVMVLGLIMIGGHP
ncbi:hypothetical protein [Alcaligenes aquatilis]|uniref:hypothetical protein n=1 Tax=Alcaligenes aquatilis TaxID=323284 RepID=UPI0013CEA4ED|nr:hypothetical protein [Alcaligenes aquatilis]